MTHIINHTQFGFCAWDILAVAVLLVVIAFFIHRSRQMKREEKDLEEEISKYDVDDAMAEKTI